MQNNIIPISFALTPRMQSFLDMRDALRCLAFAMQNDSPYAWLPAAKETHDLLVGDGIKKPSVPNIISLFDAIRKHYQALADKHPEFNTQLTKACDDIDLSAEKVRLQVPEAANFLSSDAWLTAYTESLRKQDIIGHKLGLPQLIQPLWHGEGEHAKKLYLMLEPMMKAIEHLNQILHAHVPWEQRVAIEGYDQITLASQDDIGLLIIGLSSETIAQGIIPSCSGFRSVVRLRFSQWQPGKIEHDLLHDQNYALMMVPIS